MVAALRSFIREKHVVVRSRQLDHQSWRHALLFIKKRVSSSVVILGGRPFW
jgi:hypothetical protein